MGNLDNSADVIWIADGIEVLPDGGHTSALASNRYRVLRPLEALRGRGHRVAWQSFNKWLHAEVGSLNQSGIHIIGKLLPLSGQALDQRVYDAVIGRVKELQADGVCVMADFCDDHFDRSMDGSYWRALALQVDVCLAGSDVMAERLGQLGARAVEVVGDPVDSPHLPARIYRRQAAVPAIVSKLLPGASRRLRLAWYGHPSNWKAMEAWCDQIGRATGLPRILIWVITAEVASIQKYIDDFNARHGAACRIEFVPWSQQEQWQLVGSADVVLIPSEVHDQRKSVKTANRLIDALNAGCHVIASPLPAYRPFEEFVSLTDDVVASLRAYLAQPDSVLKSIEGGQVMVKVLAGGKAIAQRWEDVLKRARVDVARAVVLPEKVAAPAPREEGAIRLNIGCGDKILPGYVNVDVVQSRAGKKPDVIADVRDLSAFQTGYADEVMAIHVVEHFWRWEVENVLKEWIRVLKPGGKLILECPNLLSACEALLANPEMAARADQSGQRSMWVFYGDPQWKDPLMVHRWGYTPQSLSDLLAGLGLVGVCQEPAHYKLREPRDMRIVGFKGKMS